ncbi:MAG TPA: HAMP domain-containing protein, partial [Albitalea sp.]
MAFTFTIQRKLVALSLVGLAFVGAVGATGYLAATRLTGAAQHLSAVGDALRHHMSADMAHDALRGDVLSALLAGARQDASKQQAIRADLARHTAQFRDAIRELAEHPLDDEAREAVAKVRTPLLAYLDTATALVGLAFTDPPAAEAGMADFGAAFTALEREMATLGDAIQERATRTEAESRATAEGAKATIAGVSALSLAVVLAIGLATGRTIVRPIRQAVAIAETVAGGDLRSRIEAKGADETAHLLAALARMNEGLVKVVNAVRLSSDNIATGSAQIASGNADLSERTERQAGHLQETAASMEQISA